MWIEWQIPEFQVGHFISQFHVLFLSVALGGLATQPTTYMLLGLVNLSNFAEEHDGYFYVNFIFGFCRDRLYDQPAWLHRCL